MLVGYLGEGAHGVLSSFHVFRAEGLVTHRHSLNESHRLGEERLEGLRWECIGKGAKTVGNSVFDNFALTVLLMCHHLKELLSELGHGLNIISQARVVNHVAEVAERIEKLRLTSRRKSLKLCREVGLCAGITHREGLIAELLAELARDFHDLSGGTANVINLFLASGEILIVEVVSGLGCRQDLLMSTL